MVKKQEFEEFEDEDNFPVYGLPPCIMSGVLPVIKDKPIEKIRVGVKKDFFDAFPNRKGEFVIDLANLEKGYQHLTHFFIKVIYKKRK